MGHFGKLRFHVSAIAEKEHDDFLVSTQEQAGLLKAATGAIFYPGINTIFVRAHYDNLLSQMNVYEKSNQSVISVVTGTPGIGKSLFAVYLLHLVLRNVRFSSTPYNPPQIASVILRQRRENDDVCWAFELTPAGWQMMRPDSTCEYPDLYICDLTVTATHTSLFDFVRNIVTVSPRGVSGFWEVFSASVHSILHPNFAFFRLPVYLTRMRHQSGGLCLPGPLMRSSQRKT